MGGRSSTCRTAFVRGLAALLATTTMFFQLHSATGAPSDIFSSPAPVLGADPPKATELKDGDASVATQTGALTYSFPIQVPPGRNGMAPHLSLSYSSQGPIYGGVASGWSLSIPEIREDTSRSRLTFRSPSVELQQVALGIDPKADDRFVSSLAGGRPLVAVTEPGGTGVYKTYRAQNDSSFARYQRMDPGQTFRWRVLTTDGTIMTFGEASRVPGCVNVNDQYAPLTGTIDAFGNEVSYQYTGEIVGECRLTKISWGQNAPAGVPSFAEVNFGYTTSPSCTSTPAIFPGSTTDYHSVSPDKPGIVMGASKLLTITATAFPPGSPGSPDHTRVITLGYDATTESCTSSFAPYRSLLTIAESAWGTDSPQVNLPAVQFAYGAPPSLSATASQSTNYWTVGSISPAHNSNLAWGYRRSDDRWPSLEAMLVDIDGDGLEDRLSNNVSDPTATITSCSATWQRNLGPDASGNLTFASPNATPIALPRLKWRGTTQSVGGSASAQRVSPSFEGCSLNGQVTDYQNAHPMNGAGCHVAFGAPQNNCVPGVTSPGPYCFPGGTECPGAGSPVADYRTYLAYRWIDEDGDGLTDLVAAIHGDIDNYDVERGNNIGYEAGEPTISGIPGLGQWPACPGQQDSCKDLGSCMNDAKSCAGGICTTHWDVVNSCLNSSPATGCFQVMARPAGGGGSNGTPSRVPYTRCEGLYPYLIYKNKGNGTFATTPTIIYQPVPLESSAADSAITGPGVAAENHAIVDFDGDGRLDAVVRQMDLSNPDSWQVFLGDGTGRFGPANFPFTTRSGDNNGNRISTQGLASSPLVASSAGLVDLNGDGLLDHWVPGTSFNVALSDGTAHRLVGNDPATAVGEVETPTSVKPGSDTNYNVTHFSGTNYPLAGTSNAQNRVQDVDGDGRADVVRFTPSAMVHFNAGGQFIATAQAFPGATDDGVKRATSNTETGDIIVEPLIWELKGDLIDLDGDGIPESAYFPTPTGTTLTRHKVATTAAPPRLLTAINNNRGGHVTVTYSTMHDATAVVQTPAQRWTDGYCPAFGAPNEKACPMASPREQWVVKSLTVTDDFPTTASSTSYLYKNPRFAPDDEGRFSFRGFQEVTATGPSGAQTLQRFGYDVDWSGRVTTSIVFPKQQVGETTVAGEVRSVDKTTWAPLTLFGGALTTFHPTISEHWACANGLTESTCTAVPIPAGTAKTTTTTTFNSFSGTDPASPPQLWQATDTLLQSGLAAADHDRHTKTTFVLFNDNGAFRLRATNVTKEERLSGVMTTYAQSAIGWDAAYFVALTDEVWTDNVNANRTIARTVYDMATGNVLERWKPVQNAAGTTRTVYAFDARKLFPVSETNELGHLRQFTWEYGTGTKLITDGPNQRACTTGVGCELDATHPLKEERKIRVDGLGRMIERWDTLSDDGWFYTLYKLESNSYIDTATPTVPTSLTNLLTIDPWGTLTKQQKTDLDGHGRPTRVTIYAQGSVPNDQITSYVYRLDGTLQSVSVPDPIANNASVVSYTYGFDSVGRPISIRRPDSTTNPSGVDILYNGMTTTTTELLGANGGTQAQTKTIKDPFGRLIEVDERTATPSTFTTTMYAYSADDNVATITAPPTVTGGLNVVTTLTHDFAGRRTMISRFGVAGTHLDWKYVYDANGNQIAEQVPGSTGPLTDPLFTTSIAYDDLDRPHSRYIAPRNLSAADQALFTSGTETLEWDTGPNHIGYLRYWQAFAPGAGTADFWAYIANDNQGNPTTITQSATIAGLPTLSRNFSRAFYPFGGAVRRTTFNDYVGGANQTEVDHLVDARALPSSLHMNTPVSQSLAVQIRNVAGLVTNRKSTTTGTNYVESNWVYDKLGRVTSQVVQKGPSITPVAKQVLTYFGNDDPHTLQHFLGAASKTFTYGFDQRHQLTTVSTNTSSYFGGTYTYGPAGRFTVANETQTINPLPNETEVKPRNVNYVYGDNSDLERVTALTNVSGGARYATFAYDAAGNMTWKCSGTTFNPTCAGESFDYLYDGKDQLRRATRKLNNVIQGSEEYWYDGYGQRTLLLKRDGTGAKTELVWFIGDVEAHYNGAGAITKIYSHLSMGTPVARVERTGDTTTNIEFQFHGLASNTLATVAQSGTINTSFSYAPFGEVLETVNAGGTTGTAFHKRRFNDKYQDDLTALTYYGARYYDKTLIGWTQGDPLFRFAPDLLKTDPRAANLYIVDKSNPLRYLDPDGRFPGAGEVPDVPTTFEQAKALMEPFIAAGEEVASEGPAGQAVGGAIVFTGAVLTGIAIGLGGPGVLEIAKPYLPGPVPTIGPPGPSSDPIGGPKETTSQPDTVSGPPAAGPTAAPDNTIEAGRGRGGQRKGERRYDRHNPNPNKPKNRDPHTGKKIKKPKPKPPGTGSGGAGSGSAESKPADANGDGKVTDKEESKFMREAQ